MDRLYADVTEHELGYFELKQKYRKDMDTFYREEYYQNSHALYRQEYDAQELAYKNNLYRQKEYIVKTISGGVFQGTPSFLDIGCGEGYALSWFAQNGWEVFGIDESLYGIRTHNPDMERHVVSGSFYEEKDRLAKKHYDFINLDNVLEHVPDPLLFLEHVAALCDSRTVVCVTVPNDFSEIQIMAYEMGEIDGPFWVTKETSEHFSYFGAASLEKAGEAAGLQKITAAADFPIDLFLLHSGSNYRRQEAGRECHMAAVALENRLFEKSVADTAKLHEMLAINGIGRDISMFFKRK